jgi:hypothetical protein
MSKGLTIASAFSGMSEAASRAKAAKAQARQQNLQREYRSQMSDVDTKSEVLDYNQRERDRMLKNQAARKAEGAKQYQGQQAADYLSPRVGTGLDAYAPGFESRLMEDVGTAPVNPLTGGTPWANALASQQAMVRGERQLDAKDMAALSAGQRRSTEDQEAMGRMGATQQGEPARTAAISTDAAVASEQVGHKTDAHRRNLSKARQTIGTKYEPWIETDIIRKEGSLGGIASSMKELMESAPTKSKVPEPYSSRLSKDYGKLYGSGMPTTTGPTGGGTWT